MKSNHLINLLIIFAVAAGLFYAYHLETSTELYTNEEQGYSVLYPSSMTVREYAGGSITIGNISEEVMHGVVDVSMIVVSGAPGQSFRNTVIENMKNFCAADGMSASITCTEADAVADFNSKNGAAGFVFYLNGEIKNIPAGTSTPLRKGPFYAFTNKSGATASSVLIVHAPLNQTADEAETETIKRVAESLKIHKTQ